MQIGYIFIVPILIVFGLTIRAWWLSDRNNRQTRALVEHLQQNQAEYWSALPWTARKLNSAGAIESYRGDKSADDPEFDTLLLGLGKGGQQRDHRHWCCHGTYIIGGLGQPDMGLGLLTSGQCPGRAHPYD